MFAINFEMSIKISQKLNPNRIFNGFGYFKSAINE